MMKFFIGQKQFSGAYEEDLDVIIEVYDMRADICDVTNAENRKAISILLKVNSLAMFARNATRRRNYAEAIKILRNWYNGSEMQSRLLN